MASRDLICAALKREQPRWNEGADAVSNAQFLDAARYHGVLPLLAMEMQGGGFEHWPDEVLVVCREATRTQAIYELSHRAADMHVIDALSASGVTPLVLKGSGLAHTLYSNPIHRPRGDTDLLIPFGKRTEAERTLVKLGYAKQRAAEGDFISYQASWTRSDAFGAAHLLDLHWRINNSQILAKSLSYDELFARAIPVQALGPNAVALCHVDALLFACIHRAGHVHAPYYVNGVAHHGIDRLIWLYDIHLLVSALSAEKLDEFAALATSKRIRAICRDALLRTHECLGTSIPARILEALNPTGTHEPSAAYLTGSRTRLMIEDFLALERWTERLGWARELAFPPARYMHSKYPEAAIRWLPILYARRGLTGISRLISARDNR